MARMTAGPPDSLREQAIQGAKWVTLSRIACEATAFAAMLALARLLTPAEVGHAAVAMVAFTLANGILAGSFGSPLIKAEHVDDRQVEVASLLSIASGLGLTALCVVTGLVLRPVLDPTTGNMVVLAAPGFLFASLAAVPQALRSRRLAFQAIMIVEVASTVAGAAAGVALAVGGAGSAAMVLGAVVTTAVAAALSPIGVGFRLPRWHREAAGPILRFGVPASASSVFSTAERNIDYALISARLAPTQVGLYYRAFTLAVDYQLKISNIVLRVLFPVLSRAKSQASFRTARSRVIRLHSVVLFPLLTMLLVTAPEVVPLLFGEAWRGSIVPTQILVGAGIATAIGTGIGPLMMAAGRPRALLVNNGVSFACFAVTVYVCSGYGLIATCIGVTAYRLVSTAVSQYVLATRLLGIPLRETLILDPGPAAVSALALVAVALPVSTLLDPLPPVIDVAVTAAAGFAAYLVVLRTVFGGAWADAEMLLTRLVPARLRRPAAVAARVGPEA